MGEQERDYKKDIEAILFASGRTVTQEEIENILDVKTPGLIKELVSELKAEYDARDGPVFLIEEGAGWKLTIKESYLPVVHSINPHTELSKATMETLSVIAWKQPILQAQVVEIRSNKAYEHISELVDLGFISKEKFGRSYLLKPTQKFLDYFDLPDQEAAKKLFKDFKDEDLQKKMGEFKTDKDGVSVDDEHLGNLQVYDAGEESDTYNDRHALNPKPKAGDMLGELEVVDETEEDIKQPEQEEQDSDNLEEESEEGSEELGEKSEESEESSEEDKAKLLAKQLLEEDQPKEESHDEDEIPSRELNPALEAYVKPEGEQEEPAQSEQQQEEPQEEQPEDEAPEEDDYEKKRKALEEEEIKKAAAKEQLEESPDEQTEDSTEENK